MLGLNPGRCINIHPHLRSPACAHHPILSFQGICGRCLDSANSLPSFNSCFWSEEGESCEKNTVAQWNFPTDRRRKHFTLGFAGNKENIFLPFVPLGSTHRAWGYNFTRVSSVGSWSCGGCQRGADNVSDRRDGFLVELRPAETVKCCVLRWEASAFGCLVCARPKVSGEMVTTVLL